MRITRQIYIPASCAWRTITSDRLPDKTHGKSDPDAVIFEKLKRNSNNNLNK